MNWIKRKLEQVADAKEARAEGARERKAAERAAAEERDAADRAHAQEVVEDYGVIGFQRDGGIRVNANDAAERKLAIKQLRLKKKEMTAQKRELTAQIAAIRAEYRTKVAGRISTGGLPRGTTGRMIRAGVQNKRRNERMSVDNAIVPIEQERNAVDAQIIYVDRAIAGLEGER